MRPSEKLAEVFRVARMCARACGADVIDPNYKINIVTYLVVFCITVYFIFSVYTVQHKISENWTVVLEAFCMVGSVFQGISKLVSGIAYGKVVAVDVKFLEATYDKYEELGVKYVAVLDKCVFRVRVMLKTAAGLYTAVTLSLVSIPLSIWAITGSRKFVMQFYIPFMEPDTLHGYLITIGMQSTCLFFGAFGNFAGDIFLLVHFTHSNLIVDIFELKIDELNREAENIGSSQVDHLLRDALNWHQAYMKYVQGGDAIFYWITFTQITTSALSLVLTLVIMFTGDWPGSYAYICISFSGLYLYCGLGTFVETANERVLDKVYDIHWYLMTLSQQKAIQFMLMSSQTMQPISVGGVAPLSVSTGLQVTKSVYSVFMMLLNFFD